MNIQEAIVNFVEAEKAFNRAKHDLHIALSENMPNPFMKIDFDRVRREANRIQLGI